jgi:hypothetical protein
MDAPSSYMIRSSSNTGGYIKAIWYARDLKITRSFCERALGAERSNSKCCALQLEDAGLQMLRQLICPSPVASWRFGSKCQTCRLNHAIAETFPYRLATCLIRRTIETLGCAVCHLSNAWWVKPAPEMHLAKSRKRTPWGFLEMLSPKSNGVSDVCQKQWHHVVYGEIWWLLGMG